MKDKLNKMEKKAKIILEKYGDTISEITYKALKEIFALLTEEEIYNHELFEAFFKDIKRTNSHMLSFYEQKNKEFFQFLDKEIQELKKKEIIN